MKIFLDANILVSVLNKEYPLFTYSARILSLADNKKFKVYTSSVCLAIAFYFAEKKSGTLIAKSKIELLVSKLIIAELGKNEVLQSLKNIQVNDFEDGIQYYAAMGVNCDAIITENIEDFYFSSIPVLNSQNFMEKYLLTSQ